MELQRKKVRLKSIIKRKYSFIFLLSTLLILLFSVRLQASSISEELLKADFRSTTAADAHSVVSEVNLTASIETPSVEAPSVELTVSPKQCVAMQQGQRCYVSVRVNFQANTADDYCLYLSTQSAALQCWEKAKQGEVTYGFDSKVDIEFVVQRTQVETTQKIEQPLAKTKVKMAWVHEKKGKPRMSWRLF